MDDILGDKDSNKGTGLSVGCTTDKTDLPEECPIFTDGGVTGETSGEKSVKSKRISAKENYYDFKKNILQENVYIYTTSILTLNGLRQDGEERFYFQIEQTERII